MTKVYVGLAVLGGIALVAWLASKRTVEVHATVTAGEPEISYNPDVPAAAGGVIDRTVYIDDGNASSERLRDLVDESNRAIAAYDAAHPELN